jgi:pyridoxal phosphate enzyme (YggS family)
VIRRFGLTTALAAVRARIDAACKHAGRDPSDVAVLAVTKGFPETAVEAALDAGLEDIGENYYQEADAKFRLVRWPAGARRHFIGRLQRNKARRIAGLFDVVQTLDDLEIAGALDRAAAAAGKMLDVLVQVNITGDERQGVAPDLVGDFVKLLSNRPHLRVRGMMAMGPKERDKAEDAFARAAACFERMRSAHPRATILSMGMSDDLELAVAFGSTMLRLGTALFGPRAPVPR